MSVIYQQNSPFFKVKQTSEYLDYSIPSTILASDYDEIIEITPKYHLLPTLLANDTYGDEKLYYIFALRNPDILKDPIYDFKQGVTIIIPSLISVQKYLESNRSKNKKME